MRTMLIAAAIAIVGFPAMGQELGYDDVREGDRSTVFTHPMVRLENGEFFPVHAGDGIDYCRGMGFYRARERVGRYVRDGLARHKGGRWQITRDGRSIRRVRCF